MIPRDYQVAAVDAVWQYFIKGNTGNPLIAMPTGTGKSLVIAKLIEGMVKTYPATHILNLTHVKELIENNYSTLMKVWPTAPAGIYSAGLNRKDLGAQITFAGIASIRGRAKLFQKVQIVIIDEAHLVSDSENTTYRRFLDELRTYQPQLKVIGLTATAYRLGLGTLTDGGLFDDICFDLTSGEAFLWMIDQGYLAPLVPKRPQVELDTSSIHIRGGEYIPSEIDDAFKDQGITAQALEEVIRHGANRRSWLLFASSIAHCDEIEELLQQHGIRAASVHSRIKSSERDERISAFKSGELQAIVNKDILTTGFDHPHIDLIAALRPTQSPGLWVQMLGRGTRPVFAEGHDLTTREGRLQAQLKRDCLVLDFAGNTRRLGPINYPVLPKRRGRGGGDPPVRDCPECGLYNHISKRVCEGCGYEFPASTKYEGEASSAEVISRLPPKPPEREVGIFPVEMMTATRHQKVGKPNSVRVTYLCGVRRFNTFVCPEHPGGAKHLAKKWWTAHSPVKNQPMPETVAEILNGWEQIRKPSHIQVVLNKKYPEIIAYDFTGKGFPYDTTSQRFGGSDQRAAGSGEAASQLSDLHEFR